MGILMKNDEPYGSLGVVQPTDMKGATSSKAGEHGLVPAPTTSDKDKFLKGDGTWSKELPNVTSSDKNKFLKVNNSGIWEAGATNADKTATWGQISGTLANQTDLKNNLNSLQGQIDNFTALTPGSTTGDAELTNIRVAANGTTYNTAGDAVRAMDGQFLTQLNAMKTGFDGVVYQSPAAMVQGEDAMLQKSIIPNNHFIAMESGTYDGTDGKTKIDGTSRIRNIVPIKTNGIISIVAPNGYEGRAYFLDSSMSFISTVGWVKALNADVFPSNAIYLNYIIRKVGHTSDDISSDVMIVENGLTINMQNKSLENGLVLLNSLSFTDATKTISLTPHIDFGYTFEIINESTTSAVLAGIYYINNTVVNNVGGTVSSYDKLNINVDHANTLYDTCELVVNNAGRATVHVNIYLNLSSKNNYKEYRWESAKFPTTYVSSALGANQRWFLTRGLMKGTIIRNASIYSRSGTENGTLTFEIWGKVGDQLVKRSEKSITFGTAVGIRPVNDINYTCFDELSFCSIKYVPESGSASFALAKISDHETRGIGSYVINDISSDTIPMFTPFGSANYAPIYIRFTPYVRMNISEPNYRQNSDYIIVGKNGDFADLQEAIYCSNECDKIVLMPGIYEGDYHCAGQTRFIEGISRDDCIIVNHKANYYDPALEMNVGALRRVTVISDATDVDTSAEGANLAYCVHCDFEGNTYNNSMIFEDCKMINANRPCIGTGLHQSYTFMVKDCDLYSGVHVAGNARGALYFHTKDVASTTDQHAQIHNTKVHCADEVAVTVMPLQSGQGDAEFIGCSIYSDINGHTDAVVWDGTDTSIFDNNFKLSPLSHGNNVSSVNAT